MDMFLPDTPDSLKIGYTTSQMKWTLENEAQLWRLMIDQELLFRNDAAVNTRFIQDGPFTSGLPRIPGHAWEMAGLASRQELYAKNPGTSLQQLFAQTDSQLILVPIGV